MDHNFDIIDAHMHLGPFFHFHIAHNDAAGLIAEMDRLGIRQGWIAAHAAIEGDATRGNDEVAEAIRAYPGRFVGYVVADPYYPEESALDIERRLATPEFKMIKIHPGLAEYPIDGPGYDAVWEFARAKNCPVLTHAWTGDVNCGPEPIRRLMKRHPGLRLTFGHALFPATFEEAAQVAREFDTVMLDITTSNHTYGIIEHAVKTIGADRLLYGSDMPFISAAGAIGKVLYAKISELDKAKILGANAQELLDEHPEKEDKPIVYEIDTWFA